MSDMVSPLAPATALFCDAQGRLRDQNGRFYTDKSAAEAGLLPVAGQDVPAFSTAAALDSISDEAWAELSTYHDRTEQAWDDYYIATEMKHFLDVDAPGSKFTDPEVNKIDDVLGLALLQRGSLEGDDRDEFKRLGAKDDAFNPNFRYIRVETPGVVGIKDTATMRPDELVRVERTKPGVPCSIVTDVTERPVTDYGVIVLAADQNTGKPRVITTFPGLVTRSSKSEELDALEGQLITVADARCLLGGDVYANARLVNAQAAAA